MCAVSPGVSIRPNPTVSFLEVFDPPLAIKRFHSALRLIGSESRRKQRQAESARQKFSRSRNVPIRGGETIVAEFVERSGGRGMHAFALSRDQGRVKYFSVLSSAPKITSTDPPVSPSFSRFFSLPVFPFSTFFEHRSTLLYVRQSGGYVSEATPQSHPRLARSILAS